MTLGLEVKGVERLDEILQRLPLRIREKVHPKLGEGAEAVAEKAREIVPVRTGYLRSTITALSRGFLEWMVAAYASYAKWVEYGSSGMAAHSFLRSALVICRPLITSLVKKGIAEAIEGRSR